MLIEHDVEAGDIERACQTKDAPSEEKLNQTMRPVAAFNEIIDGLKKYLCASCFINHKQA